MKPAAGILTMHHGAAIELLHQVRPGVWLVRPLFVDEPDREETIDAGELLKPLHTRR